MVSTMKDARINRLRGSISKSEQVFTLPPEWPRKHFFSSTPKSGYMRKLPGLALQTNYAELEDSTCRPITTGNIPFHKYSTHRDHMQAVIHASHTRVIDTTSLESVMN